jgi:hypothetical protein
MAGDEKPATAALRGLERLGFRAVFLGVFCALVAHDGVRLVGRMLGALVLWWLA